MKKSLVAIVALSGALFAASNTQIEQFVKDNFVRGNIPVKVSSTKMLDNGFEQVILDIGGRKQVMFAKGDFLFPDIINMKTRQSLGQEATEGLVALSVADVYKHENKNNIISIGNNPKNSTQFIITDPECPFCRAELKKMEAEKDKYNYKLLVTSVHGKTGYQKAYLIYQAIKNAKTDKQKFDILNKYYAPGASVDGSVSDKDVENIAKMGDKYFNAGVRGVPFIIDTREFK